MIKEKVKQLENLIKSTDNVELKKSLREKLTLIKNDKEIKK